MYGLGNTLQNNQTPEYITRSARFPLFTSRAAAESNSTVGSPFSEEEEEDHCLLKMPCRCETCLMISTKNFFLAGPGLGTLKKPKYHYMVVGGLLVQELEPLKDLKADFLVKIRFSIFAITSHR